MEKGTGNEIILMNKMLRKSEYSQKSAKFSYKIHTGKRISVK
jgi:hypothetical protein